MICEEHDCDEFFCRQDHDDDQQLTEEHERDGRDDLAFLRARIKEIADELEHSAGLFDSMRSWPKGSNGPIAVAAYESLVLRAERAVFMLRATRMRTER